MMRYGGGHSRRDRDAALRPGRGLERTAPFRRSRTPHHPPDRRSRPNGCRLPGGSTLFAAGEPSDALYVVLSGCLGVFSPDNRDRRRFMGRVLAGDTVGEMGLISGRPRSAHVVALRDTELARISSDSFNRVFGRHPRGDAAHRAPHGRSARAIAVARARTRATALAPSRFCRRVSKSTSVASPANFVKALSRFGRTELVWSVRAESHTSHWFHKIETANDFVVYVGDPTPGRWSSLCIRQADALLLLARAESTRRTAGRRSQARASRAWRRSGPSWSCCMIGQISRGAAGRWLAVQPGIPHHHVTGPPDVPALPGCSPVAVLGWSSPAAEPGGLRISGS